MDKKKKIVNADDNDVLNVMADVRNYGAGAKEGMNAEEDETDMPKDNPGDDNMIENEQLPGEIANPEEQDESDEMP